MWCITDNKLTLCSLCLYLTFILSHHHHPCCNDNHHQLLSSVYQHFLSPSNHWRFTIDPTVTLTTILAFQTVHQQYSLLLRCWLDTWFIHDLNKHVKLIWLIPIVFLSCASCILLWFNNGYPSRASIHL